MDGANFGRLLHLSPKENTYNCRSRTCASLDLNKMAFKCEQRSGTRISAKYRRFSKSSDLWLDRPRGNPFKDFCSLGIPRFDVQMSHEGEGRRARRVRPSAKMKRNKGNRGNVATLRGKITHGGGAELNGVLYGAVANQWMTRRTIWSLYPPPRAAREDGDHTERKSWTNHCIVYLRGTLSKNKGTITTGNFG